MNAVSVGSAVFAAFAVAALIMVSMTQSPSLALRGLMTSQPAERRLSAGFPVLTVLRWSASSQNTQNLDQCAAQYANYLPGAECKFDSPAWCPATPSDTEWLQADMGEVVKVTGITVQGKYSAATWGAVKEYKLHYSLDGFTWSTVQQTLTGAANQNCDGAREARLPEPVTARFLRVTPTKWTHFPSMRVGFHGHPAPKVTKLSVRSWFASSQNAEHRDQCGVESANYLPGAECKFDSPAWCPATASDTEWMQADMGKVVTVTSITVQGKYAGHTWGAVTEYRLHYSLDGMTWADIPRLSGAANQHCGGERETELPMPAKARFLRLVPTKWTHFPSMRVAFHGY